MQKSILIVSVLALTIFLACSGNSQKQNSTSVSEENSTKPDSIVVDQETQLLLDDLVANGDYVNSRDFPSMINAHIVKEEDDATNLYLDIRSQAEYKEGHIEGAVHLDFARIPEYFVEDIKPFEHKRIVLVSSNGQEAAYATCLLRLMGYGNVYAMRWGMSGWNIDYAESGWLAGCSSDFEEQLDFEEHDAEQNAYLPLLNTGKTTAEEIAEARFAKLFAEGSQHIMISAAEVFANPSKYYVINYDRKDKYLDGHIPGAFRFKPGGLLSFVDEMAKLPVNKPIVIYCTTGHNSAFVSAYLRLFGYDAYSLEYGNNSFMYNRMTEHRDTLSWLPFTLVESNEFEMVK